jgi:hypothetical protein
MNHYEVLGVSRDATPAQIRTAFRRLARAHHPDTSASGSADSLVPINDAWRVLGDPSLRRAYDRALDAEGRAATDPAQSSTADARYDQTSSYTVEPLPASSFPWRFLAGLAVVGIAIVLLGVFTYQPSKPGPPDNVLQPGSCVVIQDDQAASEVNCDTDHDGVVDHLKADDETCLAPLQPYRDQQGLGVYCMRLDV